MPVPRKLQLSYLDHVTLPSGERQAVSVTVVIEPDFRGRYVYRHPETEVTMFDMDAREAQLYVAGNFHSARWV